MKNITKITKPTLTFTARSPWLKVVAAFAMCASGCADDTHSEDSVSGKKKIAYAPYQDAQLSHHIPVSVKASVSAAQETMQPVSAQLKTSVISPDQPSTFTAPKIAQGAQGAQEGETSAQERSMIAAPGAPSSAPAVKAPTSRPSSMPAAKPASMPAGHPSSQPQQAIAAANYVYGEISLDPTLVGSVKQGSVLFVVVRRHVEGGKGMLIAATKQANITKDSFPVKYVVKQQDAMMGAPLVGKVTVSARIDQDGDAISKQPGDLITEPSAPVMVGENPVKLTITKAL